MKSQKPRLIDVNRNQNVLRAIDVERLVDDDHPVRAVWDFVGRMDLSAFYSAIESFEGEAGRPAWDPRLLVSVWIYAYSRGIGSAREIERRCEFDPAFQWLTGLEVINAHTLSDFRVSQKEKLDLVFKQALGLLSADGLITLEQVMHDGTKIQAFASAKTFRREQRIQEYLRLAEDQIKAMGNPREDLHSERMEKARKRAIHERQQKLELALKEMEKLRETKSDQKSKENARISVTDPEARFMKQSNGGVGPSYNAQISTDSAHGIIVGVKVTQNPTDVHELLPALDTIEKNFGQLPKQMVVDGGYTSSENIVKVGEKSVDLIAPVIDKEKSALGKYKTHGIEEEFHVKYFKYDEDKNIFTCPAGKELRKNGSENRVNMSKKLLYQARKKDCEICPFKPRCCPKAKRGRAISRKLEHSSVLAFRVKMGTEAAKELYKKRSAIAEFSNAWLKSKIKLRQFYVQGQEKVQLELQWACLALNIQQWTRIHWMNA